MKDSALLKQTLGDRLRKSRSVAGLTPQEMASIIGKSHAAVTAYERDQRSPGLDTIQKWAEITEVPPDWLAFGQSSTKWYSPIVTGATRRHERRPDRVAA